MNLSKGVCVCVCAVKYVFDERTQAALWPPLMQLTELECSCQLFKGLVLCSVVIKDWSNFPAGARLTVWLFERNSSTFLSTHLFMRSLRVKRWGKKYHFHICPLSKMELA